ncbi:hypothetical protein BKA64DRAFT_748557 [Cadophora sp. MPI-SDFR-AT-0126]|nr:hypothetical protein BKA64DRAFT_748557 [Leotiomycetes sp. MPI-SDFR-AT-0126]
MASTRYKKKATKTSRVMKKGVEVAKDEVEVAKDEVEVAKDEVEVAEGQIETAEEEVSQDNQDPSKELIQLAKSAGDGTVSIPGNMLASLLSNVQTLQLQVGRLHAELSGVKGDLRALEVAAGRVFPRFKKLPAEIRRMIWRLTLSMPRIVGIEEDYRTIRRKGKEKEVYGCTPFKGYNPIRYTCRESRAEAIAMQTQIFIQDGAPQIFINTEVDSVWLRIEDEEPEWVFRSLDDLAFWDYVPGRKQSDTPRVTISLKVWNANAKDQMYWLFNRLYLLGVTKIYVVVGENATYNKATYVGSDLVLIEPQKSPCQTLPEDAKEYMEKYFGRTIHRMSWPDMAKAELQLLREFQAQRARWLEDMRTQGIEVPEHWAEDEEDGPVDHWEVEEIEFVDICTLSEVQKDPGSFLVKV